VLLADVDEELALLGGELPAVAPVAARQRPESVETAAPVGVQPALERGHRERAGDVRARRTEALLREGAERSAQLAAVQVLAGEGADDLAAEARHRLGVVLGCERR
jgi:hypothetical protein